MKMFDFFSNPHKNILSTPERFNKLNELIKELTNYSHQYQLRSMTTSALIISRINCLLTSHI